MNTVYSVDHSNVPAWRERVASYIKEATGIANSIDMILDETRMSPASGRGGELDAATDQLFAAISDLERLVQQRDVLLHADDAPPFGLSLSEKLLSTRRIDDARMAKCCGELAELVAQTHQRATALFICQYHLAKVPREWVARLASATKTQKSLGSTPICKPYDGRLNEAA